MCIYIYTHTHTYIHTHINREREREYVLSFRQVHSAAQQERESGAQGADSAAEVLAGKVDELRLREVSPME